MIVLTNKHLLNGYFTYGNVALYFTRKKVTGSGQGYGKIVATGQEIWYTNANCADGTIEILQAFDNEKEAVESLDFIVHCLYGIGRRRR